MSNDFDNRIMAEFRRQRDTDDVMFAKASFLDMLIQSRAEGCDVNELVDLTAEKLKERAA